MKGTIRVELRKTAATKDGKQPISLIYSVSGQRKRVSIGRSIYPEYWDKAKVDYIPQREAKKLLPHLSASQLLTEVEVNEINDHISDTISRIRAIERRFLSNRVAFSSSMVIQELAFENLPLIKKEEPKGLVFDFISNYIADNSATRVKGSLAVYKALSVHLQAYEALKKKRITFEGIDFKFLQTFQNFLIETRNLQNTTVAKQLSTLKTFLGYARLHGIKVNESFRDFKIKRTPLEVIALTQQEFDSLLNADLSEQKKLDQVRDVFCFSCVTGLRYSDLKALNRENIKANEIIITVTKTKERLTIPLNDYSRSILEKYDQMHKPLPVISAQKMNDYLKELCEKVGISESIEIVRYRGARREAIVYPKHELITVHTGRKTFVTLSLERGMSAEEVMTISGHSDYKSFKRYVKITEDRKKVVMVKAWSKPAVKLKVI